MKSAIITGASRGIGEAVALAFTDNYDYIAICCSKDVDNLSKVENLIKNKNTACHSFVGDISDYGFAKDMIDTVIKESGSIDTLINNAGISITGLFTDTTPNQWQQIINTNLTSVYNTCHLTVPHMIRKKSGRIINISSVWGLAGASCEVIYSATKGGINSFTKALAKELAPSNIPVNAIAFGAVDTIMNSHLSSEDIQILNEEIPYGRMASCQEAGIFVKKILSMPEYFTGEIVKFDGGWI